jgi:nicotinamide mononucleotide transporter
MKRFLWSLVIGAVLTVASYGIGLALGLISTVSLVEAFAVFTSYSCTYLCVVQTRWNYPIGAVSTAAWSLLFWQTGMPALALFNLYLVFSLAYGYFRWRDDANTRPVTKTDVHEWGFYAAVTLVVAGLYLMVIGFFGAPFSWIDIGLAASSGAAQLMLDNKKLENWWVWIVVDLVSIPYMFVSGLPVTALQYLLFTANAFWGLWEWNKSNYVETLLDAEVIALDRERF